MNELAIATSWILTNVNGRRESWLTVQITAYAVFDAGFDLIKMTLVCETHIRPSSKKHDMIR